MKLNNIRMLCLLQNIIVMGGAFRDEARFQSD